MRDMNRGIEAIGNLNHRASFNKFVSFQSTDCLLSLVIKWRVAWVVADHISRKKLMLTKD